MFRQVRLHAEYTAGRISSRADDNIKKKNDMSYKWGTRY